ncbi:hypothetical protein DPMN_122935 [Dreissena polymorpha]|uniref:Uncharacterized protein n=1 Tax=Dreissena polymorpha TaxID=45954 RepID=A0A9D4GTC9_DREPO|nr:hypothetical protein DPMN_122935 [Dreissena polymorpha]
MSASQVDACLSRPISGVRQQMLACACTTCTLNYSFPLIDEEVGDMINPAVTNNTPIQGAAVNKRHQLIELFS